MVTARTTSTTAKSVKVVASKPITPAQFGAQNPVIYRHYSISTPRLTWTISHNLNTKKFNAVCRDEEENVFTAKITTIDSNSFTIDLTEAIRGTVDVIFDTSTTQPIVIA
jgi:hypothetical protein